MTCAINFHITPRILPRIKNHPPLLHLVNSHLFDLDDVDQETRVILLDHPNGSKLLVGVVFLANPFTPSHKKRDLANHLAIVRLRLPNLGL